MDTIVQPVITPEGDSRPSNAVRVAVKAVPGSSRDAIAGPLGDRLKVRVTAPPEDGKANKAIEALLASACGLPVRSVLVVSGYTRPEKTVELQGIDVAAARARLGLG